MEKTILTITGSDSTGDSGIQADIRTIMELGGTATSVITSITVQNTLGIVKIFDLPSDVVDLQLEAIVDDVMPCTVKIGMVRSRETLMSVIRMLKHSKPEHVVFNPNINSSRGEMLISQATLKLMCDELLPLCTLVVIKKSDEKYILNHSVVNGRICIFYDRNMHGFSNAFVSAVCVGLSRGNSIDQSIIEAHEYVRNHVIMRVGLVGRSSQLYNDFVSLVKTHISEYKDLQFYADRLSIGTRYLSQVTKNVASKSPKTIIDDILIYRIKKSINTTDKSLQQIAYDFSFSSQAQFTRFFKKMTGKTPGGYRKKHNR